MLAAYRKERRVRRDVALEQKTTSRETRLCRRSWPKSDNEEIISKKRTCREAGAKAAADPARARKVKVFMLILAIETIRNMLGLVLADDRRCFREKDMETHPALRR